MTLRHHDGPTLLDGQLPGPRFDRNPAWTTTTLTGVNLAGQNLTNASFIGATLTNANFSQANLTNATSSGGTLTNANFSQANLTNANFDWRHADRREPDRGRSAGGEFLLHAGIYDGPDSTRRPATRPTI